MRLPSLCMQALGLGYSTVWANRAGGQSTIRLWLKTSPQGGTAFPVKRKTLLNLLYNISLDSIIQGRVTPVPGQKFFVPAITAESSKSHLFFTFSGGGDPPHGLFSLLRRNRINPGPLCR